MPEQLTDKQSEYLRITTDFIENTLLPLRSGAGSFEKSAAIHKQIVKASQKAGLYYLTQPKKFGGSEASNQVLTVVRETLAAANTPYSGSIFGPGPGVLADCNEYIESSYLKPLLNGDKRGAFGFTEPKDAAQHTQAKIVDDGFIVNGQKSYITGGSEADFINTYVDVLPGGKSMLLIDTHLPGVVKGEVFQSLDGSHHAEFTFDNVQVPAQNLLGSIGKGLPRALRQIGNTRLAFSAESVGLMCWITDYVEQHLKTPHPSGQSLGDREGVRLRFADMRIQTYVARSMLYRTARLADGKENVMNEVIAAKVFSTETLATVLDIAIQLVGGKALVEQHPLAILYRKIRALRIAEGASDVLRLSLSKGALDLNMGRL
ncbi:MAG: acyl-CoA/acyl-ACP dehydrogenase [Pseudomonadales bacterium]|nr:acyl-CoA/acyl-ACP dehydrogenase [Pseudomonadales bacterium]